MKAVVAAFNQEKALVGAFSVITNLRMELFEALLSTHRDGADGEVGEVPGLQPRHHVAVQHEAAEAAGAAQGGAGHQPQTVVGQVQQREAEACGIELQTKDKEKGV